MGNGVQDLAIKSRESIDALSREIDRLRAEHEAKLQELSKLRRVNLGPDTLREFLRRPYVIGPSTKSDTLNVYVPKWYDLQVGWPSDLSNESFNVFEVNHYTQWFGEVPEEMREELRLPKPEPLHITDGVLSFPEEYEPVVATRYGRYLTSIGKGKARIKTGREFDVIAEIIDRGSLPFEPHPVDPADLREPQVNFKLEDKYAFQREPVDIFMKYGMVGIYYFPGSGKSFVIMYILDSLKGKKAIIAPTRLIIDQWVKEYLPKYAPRLLDETEVCTYHAWPKLKNKEFTCVAYDECVFLPADTFARLSTLRTKYRIGACATPERADGRTNYVISLTGPPRGMNWKTLMQIMGKTYHEVNVYVVKNRGEKISRVRELTDFKEKTLIFSDSIDFGKQIAHKLGVPHIHGATKSRLEPLKEQNVIVASRVADYGVSIQNLEHIVEADFLFGSVRQEIQRGGRLMHSLARVRRHDVLFTEDEYFRHRKRLSGLMAKGFKINVRTWVREPLRMLEAPARRARIRAARTQRPAASTVPPQIISTAGEKPILDERTRVNRELINFLLRTPYAKSKQGLEMGDFVEILKRSHVQFNYEALKSMVKSMFKSQQIDSARISEHRRRYYVKETLVV